MEIIKAIKKRVPGMVGSYPSSAKIYRERGGTPKLEEVGAVRMQYDDLPDMHRIETGEETKAVDLEAIIETYENKDHDNAVHIVEGVPGPDGNKRDLVLQNTFEHGKIQKTDTFDGSPAIHFYEAESGQLVNWVPKFMDTDKIDGDVHKKVRNGDTDGYDIPEGIKQKSDASKVGIRPYLIENKDQRLNAWLDHLKRKFEKYEGGEGFWSQHTEIAILFALGFSIAIVYYAVLPNIGSLVPLLEKLVDMAPNTGFEKAAQQFANRAGESAATGGAPPGR